MASETQFDRAYAEVVLGNEFFERPGYYQSERPRYRRTIDYIASLPLPLPARVLEVGGGQIALLMSRLFAAKCTVADISGDYASAVTKFGIEFVECDLVHDYLPGDQQFDLVVLCEVMEHFAIPPHIVLAKIRRRIRPGGFLFLTTPNVYRLRNVLRLAVGMPVFSHFFYPDKGLSLGHPLEYSAEHVAFQVQKAGFEVEFLERAQLSNAGASLKAHIARLLCSPLLKMVPRWRDNLVCAARNPSV